VPLLDIQLCRM